MRIRSFSNAALAAALVAVLPLPVAAADRPKRESDFRAPKDGGAAEAPDRAFRGWKEGFATVSKVQSAGEYHGSSTWNLESFSAVCLEPSVTGFFSTREVPERNRGRRTFAASRVGEVAKNQIVFEDTVSALNPNEPGAHHFYKRAPGAISALGWVDDPFRDMLLSGVVNTEGGPAGKGSKSRQGLMARWDRGNNFYWFHVDFALGEYSVLRGSSFGTMKALDGTTGRIADFDAAKAYQLEFSLVGDTVRGRVLDVAAGGKVVGDTRWQRDPEPWFEGVAGFLAEPALKQAWAPLEGSFANITARALGPKPERGDRPAPAAQASRASAEQELRQAREKRAGGDLKAALDHYYAALRHDPDSIAALNDVAWIRATSADPELRDSREAVILGEKAITLLMKGYNMRRDAPAGGAETFAKLDAVKVGVTLAAAYASDGRFNNEALIGKIPRQRALKHKPTTASLEQVQEALVDSEENACGATLASQLIEVSESLFRNEPRKETEQIIATLTRHREMYERNTLPIGEAQP